MPKVVVLFCTTCERSVTVQKGETIPALCPDCGKPLTYYGEVNHSKEA